MANNIIKRIWNQNRMVNIEDLCGMAFQAESGGHTFEISGVDDTGAVVPLSGTVTGVFRRPDNADIALTGAASGGVASVTLTDDCYAVPGRFGLTIYTTADGQKTAVYAAVGTVAATNGGAVAGDTPQDVVDLINAIEAAVATIPADYTDLMASIAPMYSNSALYAVGSYAWYDGDLYRCTTAITTAESWTAAHWTAAVLGDDIGDLKADLNNINYGYINLYDKNDIDLNKYYIDDGTTRTDQDMFVTNPILLPQRKTLFYDGLTRIYSSPKAVYFDSNRTFITNSAFKALSGKNTLDNIPSNAVYIAFSVDKTDLNTFTFGYDMYSDIDNSIEYNQNMIGEVVTNENYADPNGWTTGAYIDAINGAIVTANHYSYQYVPFFSHGNYCIYRKYSAFGEKASYVSLHDESKKYVKTISATSYNQSTGIAVFQIDKDDLVLCKYIGISTFDNEIVNVIKGDNYTGDYVPNAWEIDLARHIKTKLHGGTLICDGDSISYGARDFPLNLHGWFSRLVRDNSMTGENFAVNGATISYQDASTHCISRNIETIHSNYTADDVDYLFLEGGTNDADIIGRIIEGTIPAGFGTWDDDDFSGNYDDTTFCGAVETLFYKAINYFPKSKIGFIIPMQMGSSSVNVKSIKNRRAYYDEVIKIADKWHIPVLDLWKISTMDGRLSVFYDVSMTGDQNVTAKKYYYDGQHPTSYGYDFMQDKIQRWAESL